MNKQPPQYTYTFSIKLTDQEAENLVRAGDIFRDKDGYTIDIKVSPDDLVPENLQADVKDFLGRTLKSLFYLKPIKRTN